MSYFLLSDEDDFFKQVLGQWTVAKPCWQRAETRLQWKNWQNSAMIQTQLPLIISALKKKKEEEEYKEQVTSYKSDELCSNEHNYYMGCSSE